MHQGLKATVLVIDRLDKNSITIEHHRRVIHKETERKTDLDGHAAELLRKDADGLHGLTLVGVPEDDLAIGTGRTDTVFPIQIQRGDGILMDSTQLLRLG